MYVLVVKTPALVTLSDFTVAITTVNRPITARFKWYFGVFAALGTCHRKHLTSGPVAAAAAAAAAITL